MKIQTEVIVPQYTAVLNINDSDLMLDGRYEVFIPESEQEVEIDLEEIDFDRLKEFVQDETDCTLVENDRLRFIDEFEEDFSELIECFEKHCLNYIQKQDIVQSIINQLNGD